MTPRVIASQPSRRLLECHSNQPLHLTVLRRQFGLIGLVRVHLSRKQGPDDARSAKNPLPPKFPMGLGQSSDERMGSIVVGYFPDSGSP
jgi:hypothetical protein